MNKKLWYYTAAGVIFVALFGSLLHFVYEWSGQNFFVGLFTPINESTWEHMKLLFFPMLVYSFFEIAVIGKHYPCLYSSLFGGIILGSVFIPVIFYTYTGVLGFHILVLDIAVFIVSILVAFFFSYYFTITCRTADYEVFLNILVFVMAAAFLIFTIFPPNIGIFTIP